MYLTSATIVAFATLGQAFLLPPQISKADKDVINTLPFEYPTSPEGEALSLPCTGCPVLVTDVMGNKIGLKGVNSQLQLNFTVAHEEVDKLMMNGVEIYPTHDFPLEPLTAPQVPSAFLADSSVFRNVRLGYELAVQPVAQSAQDHLELINIRLQIVEIADVFVDGLESVEVKLLQTSSGKFMIGNLETKSTTNPSNATGANDDCTSLLCKWRAIVGDKLNDLKHGCSGMKRPGTAMPSEPRPATHPRPNHHDGNHRQGHHVFRGVLHALKGFAIHVLLPISVGVLAGMTASLVGMLVGQFVVMVWRSLFRRSAYIEVQQEDLDEEAKRYFIQRAGPPPVYEDIVVEKSDN
jgi:hypothetical protein